MSTVPVAGRGQHGWHFICVERFGFSVRRLGSCDALPLSGESYFQSLTLPHNATALIFGEHSSTHCAFLLLLCAFS
ncbi:MAG TPA: hypothetical protein VJ761_11235 [Ktedonobacteraceae bacterium]|nr:hypothetical protein [Ktedonobacteraceae bacterium]